MLSVMNGTVSLSLTVSIGVAELGAGDSSIEPVLMRADSCLYRAKQEGRNRVCVDRPLVSGSNLCLF